MQLTIFDLHFVLAMGNLGSKNLELAQNLQSELLKDCP